MRLDDRSRRCKLQRCTDTRTYTGKGAASCWTTWVRSTWGSLDIQLASDVAFVLTVPGSWEPEELAALSKDTVIKLHARYVLSYLHEPYAAKHLLMSTFPSD